MLDLCINAAKTCPQSCAV